VDVDGLSPEEYRHLLARSPIPMFVHDQESRLLEVNQAVATLLEYHACPSSRVCRPPGGPPG
jgi:PAS domain-containing protein